ncbi:hypothetical protein U9M48_038131 [Paspalum notatum var. saurae]|uniref:F-box domain-containing protein n=1 Tax=Paspalum notatum var. saurae TaxID=547442 RepID=A0AAQ3UMP1_PASNO
MEGDMHEQEPPPALIIDQETRDWDSLPINIVWEILRRLCHEDLLRGAGLACASWRRLAVEEPRLWRSIDLAALDDDDEGGVLDEHGDERRPMYFERLAMARTALDRSAGRCESYRGPADRHLLVYLADRAPSLRSLQVTSTWCLPKAYIDSVITKLPMLERLELAGGGVFMMSTLRALLKHCPRLEVLKADGRCTTDGHMSWRLWRKCERSTLRVLYLPGRNSSYCPCWACREKRNTVFPPFLSYKGSS